MEHTDVTTSRRASSVAKQRSIFLLDARPQALNEVSSWSSILLKLIRDSSQLICQSIQKVLELPCQHNQIKPSRITFAFGFLNDERKQAPAPISVVRGCAKSLEPIDSNRHRDIPVPSYVREGILHRREIERFKPVRKSPFVLPNLYRASQHIAEASDPACYGSGGVGNSGVLSKYRGKLCHSRFAPLMDLDPQLSRRVHDRPNSNHPGASSSPPIGIASSLVAFVRNSTADIQIGGQGNPEKERQQRYDRCGPDRHHLPELECHAFPISIHAIGGILA
ncbi:Uncharacterised protein [Stenotrophomonas maltophilia]|nr:Uncharacterised protein [Stenotrophomonas maltophilia]